jgi:hypothetical protein
MPPLAFLLRHRITKKLFWRLAAAASFLLLVAAAAVQERKVPVNPILSGQTWFDTDNHPIEAHGGGLLLDGGVYYWYGENHALGSGNHVGISCYSSRDLIHWRNEGVVLPKTVIPAAYGDTGVAERPKVLHNHRTGKYVMWMHLDNADYSAANAGTAIADRPQGPFRFQREFRPIHYNYGYRARAKDAEKILQEPQRGNAFRDMNLFLDNDGAAYVFYSSEDNQTMYVVRLNQDFTGIQQPAVLGSTWARIFINESREAPAPFRYRNRYYLVTSAQTGWSPNAAELATASSVLGPWKKVGNPAVGRDSETTFHSQSTQVIPLPDAPAGNFIFLSDRWNGEHLERSTYIWLPFRIRPDGLFTIEYWPGWTVPGFLRTSLAPAESFYSASSARNAHATTLPDAKE